MNKHIATGDHLIYACGPKKSQFAKFKYLKVKLSRHQTPIAVPAPYTLPKAALYRGFVVEESAAQVLVALQTTT